MCVESAVTFACGHWDTVVVPCSFQGTMGCQVRTYAPPQIKPFYCSPACPGVSVWAPPPRFSWQPTPLNMLPTSMYPFTSSVQQAPPSLTSNIAERNAQSLYEQSLNIAEQSTSSRYEPTPTVSAGGTQPNQGPVYGMSSQDIQAHCTPIPSAPNPIPGTAPSAPSHGLTGQCLITRWQPFEPMFYPTMIPQRRSAPEQDGKPPNMMATNKEVQTPAYQGGFPSPYRPRAPIAQMYEEGQQPVLDIIDQRYQTPVKASKKANGVASVSNTPYMMTGGSSDTSETLTSGDDNEDEDYSAGYNYNGADGVVDTRTTPHTYGDYDNVTSGVNVQHSLRINENTGRFHLGPQWQVPSARVARAKAGTKSGKASTWSEQAEPRPSGTVAPSMPKVHTTFADEVMAVHMQTLDLANLHRPLPGSSNGPTRKGPQQHRKHRKHQITPNPLTAALRCRYPLYPETEDDNVRVTNKRPNDGPIGEGSQSYQSGGQHKGAPKLEMGPDGCLVLIEAPDTIDLSMRGARGAR
ncbi:hypothetical protein CHU98_g8236 [Xylaria longipes]|nr:hypothetical protein CHU98_g8236 [Xylaria longipes]